MRRASDETWGQRWVRRWVHAQFRGGERPVPTPEVPGANVNTLNDYLASGPFARWAERWFWLVMFIVAVVAAGLCIGLALSNLAAYWGAAVFGLALLYFALRILAGVRCLFRNRKRPRRKSRH
ncbi:amiloride-sensitive sodium channel family protein [Paramicrobacterium fandaimingii]|uniref:amiloride-sensitive sodium channel family protein n=1 Tax=Paramicrobacterium fandaimingii TaxID=2708079 RepID=UPI001422ACEF|nr:amiloride-sensitive sodium channel family protein [Microbacterium fandaimingii]